jgi:hypothetical protein
MTTSLTQVQTIADPIARFRALLEYFAEIAALEGTIKQPYTSPELLLFQKMKPTQQEEAIRLLTLTLEVFDETRAEGYRLKDNPQLLWRCLRRLKMTPRSDVFDRISDTDVVEVYSPEYLGIFRNLQFYDKVSYPIEDVFCEDLWALSEREPVAAAQLREVAQRFFEGQIQETYDPQIPEHLVWETKSPLLFDISVKIKFLSPLFSNGNLCGTLAVNNSRVVRSRTGELTTP